MPLLQFVAEEFRAGKVIYRGFESADDLRRAASRRRRRFALEHRRVQGVCSHTRWDGLHLRTPADLAPHTPVLEILPTKLSAQRNRPGITTAFQLSQWEVRFSIEGEILELSGYEAWVAGSRDHCGVIG